MQDASPKNLPSVLRYGGCAFLVAWFLLFFSGEIWGADFTHAAETVVALSLISIAGCFVTLLVINWLGRTKALFSKPLGQWFFALGVLLSVGTVGIVFANHLPLPVFIIACLLIGPTGAVFICVTVLQLARLAPRAILINCGAIFLVGILIYSFAFYVPHQITTIILCVLPFLASCFFAVNTEGITAVETKTGPPTGQPVSWRTVMLLSVFMLFSCVVRGYLPYHIENEVFSYARSFSIILMLVLAAVVVIVPAVLPVRYRISNLYRVILIFGLVLFALFPIFGMDNTIALVLADGYRGLCALMALAYFACLARTTSFFGGRNVCGGLALYVSFGIVGWLVGSVLHYADPGEDFLRIYSSIQCVVVVLAFILLYRQSEFEQYVDIGGQAAKLADGAESQQGDEGLGGRWRQRVVAIARKKGLTSREEEVFWLLAKGYKAQNISDKLSISYNTTRAHIRNIYQKCDVHSQQEFVDLIDAASSLSEDTSQSAENNYTEQKRKVLHD